MAKRNAEDVPIDNNAGRAKSNTMFGWCMTSHHKDCIVEFIGHECSCACHKEKTE